MITITSDEFDLLRGWIEQECGIALQTNKQYLIESRFANLLVENGCTTFGDFYRKAKSDSGTGFRDKIIDAITTNETLWFRDESPFVALKENVFPQFGSSQKPCRIWSAACSTGQEPYSIAMIASEYAVANNKKDWLQKSLSILGSDISGSALMLAKNARYNTIAMSRGLASEYQTKYFEQDGQIHKLKDDIKKMVQFQKFNLQMPFCTLGKFDVIFLRNVAIYFSHEFKVELFHKLAGALNPGGYLFIGASETLIGYSDEFDLIEHNRSRFFKLKK